MPYPPKDKDEEKKPDATALSKGLVTAASPEDAVEKAKAMMDKNGNSPVVSVPMQPTGKSPSPVTGTQLEQGASPLYRFGGTIPQPGNPNNLSNWLNSSNSNTQLPLAQVPGAVAKSFSENPIKPEGAPNKIDSTPFTPIVPIPKAPVNSTLPSTAPDAPTSFKPVVPIPSAPADSTLPRVSDPQHPAKEDSDKFYRLTHTKYNPLSPADRDSMAQLQGIKAVPDAVKAENPTWDPTMSVKQWKATQTPPPANPVQPATPATVAPATTPAVTAQDALKPNIAGVPTSTPTSTRVPSTTSSVVPAPAAPVPVPTTAPAANPSALQLEMRPVYNPEAAGNAAMGKVNPFVQRQMDVAYDRAATMKDPTARANYLAQVTSSLGETQSAFAQRAQGEEARKAGLVKQGSDGRDLTLGSRPYAGQVIGMTDADGKNIDAKINNAGAPSQGSVTFGKPTAQQMALQHLDDLDTNKAILAQDRAIANGTDMSGRKIVDEDQYGMGHVRQPDKAMQTAIANGTYAPGAKGTINGVKGEQYLQQNSQDMYRRGLTNEGSQADAINKQINERIKNGQGFGDLLKQFDQAAQSPDFNRSKVTPEYVKGSGQDSRDPYAGSQIDPRSLDAAFGKVPGSPQVETSAPTLATEKIPAPKPVTKPGEDDPAFVQREIKETSASTAKAQASLDELTKMSPGDFKLYYGNASQKDAIAKAQSRLDAAKAEQSRVQSVADYKPGEEVEVPVSPKENQVSVKEALNPGVGMNPAVNTLSQSATPAKNPYALPSPQEQEKIVQQRVAANEERNAPLKASEGQRWGNYYANQAMEKATADRPNGDPLRDTQIAVNIAEAAKQAALANGATEKEIRDNPSIAAKYLPNPNGFNALGSSDKLHQVAMDHLRGSSMRELVQGAVDRNIGGSRTSEEQNRRAIDQNAKQATIDERGEKAEDRKAALRIQEQNAADRREDKLTAIQANRVKGLEGRLDHIDKQIEKNTTDLGDIAKKKGAEINLASLSKKRAQIQADLDKANGLEPEERGTTEESESNTQQPSNTPPPITERVPGKIYNSPKGNIKWTGTGWIPA